MNNNNKNEEYKTMKRDEMLGFEIPKYKNKIRYHIKLVGKQNRPIMIVGMSPGRQRKGQKTRVVWEGNRSSDLLNEIIQGKDNLLLTNIVNYYSKNKFRKDIIDKGLKELKELIIQSKPRKILLLGDFAYNSFLKIQEDINFITYNYKKFTHPSYILRFNKNKENYKKEILEWL